MASDGLTLRWRMPAGTHLNVRWRWQRQRRSWWLGAEWSKDPDYVPMSGDLRIQPVPSWALRIWWWATDPEGVL